MLMVNASCYDSSNNDAPNDDYPIVATSAGHYQLLTRPNFYTMHHGRRDYQLLYVRNGSIHYYLGEQEFIAPQGSLLIYHPNQVQHYIYYLEDNSDIYWVHFTGSNVAQILDSLGLSRKTCYPGFVDSKYDTFFNEIINELLYRKTNFMELSSVFMHGLLLYIQRNQSVHVARKSSLDIVENIRNMLDSNYQTDVVFSDLAREFYISPSQLTKYFTAQYGVSPRQYLSDLRIGKAKALLLSNTPVKHIAELVGFSDQLYFSRFFRKRVGVSPSEYREMHFDPSLIRKMDDERNAIVITHPSGEMPQKDDVK